MWEKEKSPVCTAYNRIVYVRRLEAARVRKTPVGLAPFVVFSRTHIARPRNAAHCFKGGGQRHIQPERYAKYNFELVGKYWNK